jgi:threonine dehydrogenase-like Zn-dependent dehydrogenase
MKALFLDNGKPTLRTDYPRPVPQPGEVLIRPTLLGVCSTDLELCRGYMNYAGVLGHEFVGVVEAVASEADKVWVGKRVVGTINCPTETCDMTRRGWPEHARIRTVLGILGRDGCFAERFTLPAANLLHVPDNVPDEVAVFTEPTAAAFEILTQVNIDPHDRVLIFGDGRLGLLCAQVIATKSRHVEVIGKHDAKLALARSWGFSAHRLGDHPANADRDVVVDCTGSDTGFAMAVAAARPRGTIVLKTTVASRPDAKPINLAPIVINELTIVGSRCGPFDRALEALASGAVRVKDLIGLTLPLSDAANALEQAKRRDIVKVLIRP